MAESEEEDKKESFSLWFWRKSNAPFFERLEFMFKWIIPRAVIFGMIFGFVYWLGKLHEFMTG